MSKINFGHNIEKEYLRIKFRIFKLRNKSKQNWLKPFILALFKIYYRCLHIAILLFKGSDESFKILKEDLFREFSDLIENTKSKKKSRVSRTFLKLIIFTLKKFQNSFYLLKDDVFAALNDTLNRIDEYKSDNKLEKVKNTIGKIKNKSVVDENSLLELEKELFEYNKYKQKKVKVYSISGISTLVIAALCITFISTILFPQAMKIGAASYGWAQTDWSGGASTTAVALHPGDTNGWTYYYSKDDGVSTTTDGQLSFNIVTQDRKIDTENADWQAHSTSSTYYANGSVGIAKPNGFTCTTAAECNSGFCADGYCCNTACTGATCRTCGIYSDRGAGTCGYVNNSSQDPDNQCAATGCGTGNCTGNSYACGYATSGTGNCAACQTCVGATSATCVAAGNSNWGSDLYNCTGVNKRCYLGTCTSCGGRMNAGYCWYEINAGSCNQACASHNGVYNGTCDWVNDPSNCSTCGMFYTVGSCSPASEGPSLYGGWTSCFYHQDGGNNCDYALVGKILFCACNN